MTANAPLEKFPHTRGLLSCIWRENNGLDSSEDATDCQWDPRLLTKATYYLQHEQGEELKALLKESFGSPNDVGHDLIFVSPSLKYSQDAVLDEQVLNLMHKHMDDVAGVPFFLLTLNRRPISRPSSRASSRSVRLNRPDTPNSIPSSPLGVAFKRPFTPLASPKLSLKDLAASHITNGGRGSPLASGSPLCSPKPLNVKASDFKPSPRPLSAAGSSSSLLGLRSDTPSPDLWSHKNSNLAIAAPLVPDNRLLPTRPTSLLAKSSILQEDEDSDRDPFLAKSQPSSHPQPLASDKEHSSNLTSSSDDSSIQDTEVGTPATENLFSFDNLNTMFKSTLSQPEIDEALERNGYDFEATRVWIEGNSPSGSTKFTPLERMMLFPAGFERVFGNGGGFVRGGFRGRPFPRGGYRQGQIRGPAQKMCRYYMAGECIRADCRFR